MLNPNTLQQVEALPNDKKLLVLHPAAAYSHRQVAYHMLNTGHATYLQLSTADFPTLLENLSHSLHQQADLTLKTIPDDPHAAAQSVAQAINQTDKFTLYMEGYDVAASHTLDTFILNLVEALTPKHRVIISSRNFPMPLLQDSQCAMLPNDPENLLIDYTAIPDGTSILEVRCLGPGQAMINGRPLESWDGLLPKNLFFYVVDRGMTTRDDIFATFWSELEKREATNVFHVTKRKISEILGEDLTTYGSGFYRIADKIQLHYDVVALQEAVQDAAVTDSDDEAIILYQRAIRLYRGHYLSTHDLGWVVKRREELQQVYIEALTGLARIYQERGKQQEALGLYLRTMPNAPEREDLIREIMSIYRDLHQPELALAIYDRLADTLKKSLNVKPDTETRKLADDIKRHFS